MRRNHPGILQQVYWQSKEQQQWWPGTVTATARPHHYNIQHSNIHLLSYTAPPFGGARSRTANIFGLSVYLLMVICVLTVIDVEAEQNTEQSGWELSIANGLLLFKREKSSQSRQESSSQQSSTNHSEQLKSKQYPSQHYEEERDLEEYQYIADSKSSVENFSLENENWFMPAVKTHFSSEISGVVARSTIVQTFKNPTNEWLNGTYQFPLPEDSAVDFLQMRIGQREIIGEIQRKKEARKQFLKAQQKGQKASLVEQQRANLFTTSLANIGPNEEIEIEIQFQQQARYVDGEFRLRFPTTFIPRAMIPNTEESSSTIKTLRPETGTIVPGLEPNFTASIRVNAGNELTYLRSPGYAMTSEHSDDFSYQMNIATPQYGDRDMELLWRYQDASPQVLHYREATSDGEYGLLMLLPGDISSDNSSSETLAGTLSGTLPVDRQDTDYLKVQREVTFVIDTSSSMAGKSIVQAKAALKLAVESLGSEDSFNIIEFNSMAKEMWSYPKPAHSANTQQALRFLDNLKADGGTNISLALHSALITQKSSLKLKQLVFITDGAIGYEEELLRDLETQLGNMRLFTVGIGSAPNSYFMVAAAKAGRGGFTHISDLSQVSERMTELLQKLAKPSITNIHTNFGMDVEMYPANIPDLYDGEPILLSYFAPQAVSHIDVSGVTAKGSAFEKLWKTSIQLEYLDDPYTQQETGIAKYWAQFKIRELLRQKRLAPARNDDQETKILVEKITQTALTHNLVSSYTSLIAIEREITRDDSVNYAAIQDDRFKPQRLMASMPNTAAGSSQAFYLAFAALLLAMMMSLWSGLPGFRMLKLPDYSRKGEHHVSQ